MIFIIFFHYYNSVHLSNKKTMLNNILTKCNLLPSNKHKLYNDKTWNGFCETTNTSGKRLGKLCNRLLYKQNNGEKIC